MPFYIYMYLAICIVNRVTVLTSASFNSTFQARMFETTTDTITAISSTAPNNDLYMNLVIGSLLLSISVVLVGITVYWRFALKRQSNFRFVFNFEMKSIISFILQKIYRRDTNYGIK